jgi:hypothetical protein
MTFYSKRKVYKMKKARLGKVRSNDPATLLTKRERFVFNKWYRLKE